MQKLSCNNLTISYQKTPVIKHLNVEFKMHTTNAIIGPNGAGKSTLLKAILNEIKVDTGNIEISGIAKDKIAYLPQISDIDNSIPFTVFDVVSIGLLNQTRILGGLDKKSIETIELAIIKVGLEKYTNKLISELSKGQLQRALIAKLIAQSADIIILDEPFNAIDSKTVSDILKLIHEWQTEGKTIIAVLHDINQVAKNFEYTLLLAHKMVEFGKTKTIINKANLEKAYKGSLTELIL